MKSFLLKQFRFFYLRISKHFTNKLYDEAKQALCPQYEEIYKYPVNQYTSEQMKIINLAKKKIFIGIRGAAGSGKSQTIAKIALDKLLSNPNSNILILGYNITLENFFRLLLRKACRNINYKQGSFTINYYHCFLKMHLLI